MRILKKFIHALVVVVLSFAVFIPPVLIGILLERTLPFQRWNTVIALYVILIMWLVIAFNLYILDPLMKKWRRFCRVDG